MPDWDITVSVEHLNEEQWNKFLWQAKNAHSTGFPIEAQFDELRVAGKKIEAGFSTLSGSDQGAVAILDEFVKCLDSSCEEVIIDISSLSSTGFESLFKAIEMLNAQELVVVSCGGVTYSEKKNEFDQVTLTVREGAIDSLPSLVKPLFPELS